MDARAIGLSRGDALRLAGQASKIVVAKGKRVAVFDLRESPPDDETLLKAMLGPTGKLRAPTIRARRTLLVGFSEQEYRSALL